MLGSLTFGYGLESRELLRNRYGPETSDRRTMGGDFSVSFETSHVYVGNPHLPSFLEAVLWSAAQWRSVAIAAGGTGAWNHVFKLVCPVATTRCLAPSCRPTSRDPDLQHPLIDKHGGSAHRAAAAEQKLRRGGSLGRSRGGFGTRFMPSLMRLGNLGLRPHRWTSVRHRAGRTVDQGIPGPRRDRRSGLRFRRVREGRGGTRYAKRSSRPFQSPQPEGLRSAHLYKERHLVESFQQDQALSPHLSRFEKTAHHFMAFLILVGLPIWTR